MADRLTNVLFLCTGNSARSILAEAIVNHRSKGRFRGFSAGSYPKGQVHPYAIDLLRSLQIPTDGLRSKSWDEFAAPQAPAMDVIVTVCDQAAGEVCPVWPGTPVAAHWGIPDPAAAAGTEREKRNAFRNAFARLERRITMLMNLRVETLDRVTLRRMLADIGHDDDASPAA